MGETRSLNAYLKLKGIPWAVSSAKSLQGKASNEKNFRRMNKLLVADAILQANLQNNSGPLSLSLSLLFLAM